MVVQVERPWEFMGKGLDFGPLEASMSPNSCPLIELGLRCH